MTVQNARRRFRLVPVLATLAGATSLLPVGSEAAVSFSPFNTLTEVLTTHAAEERVVMMVISQRDWCAPCIALDTQLLRNPDEDKLARLTEDWVVIEVNGYDDPWATQLKQHGIEFAGTPTTLVVQLDPSMKRLREGRLLGSIVGYPDDYMDRIESIAAAKGPNVREMEAKARKENDLDTWLALAETYIERGQASRARAAYRNVLSVTPEEAKAMGVDEQAFDTIRQNARWTLITRVYQRLMNDHRAARAALQSFGEDYLDFTQTDEYVYADSWTEANLNNATQANGVMKNHFVEPGTVDGLLTYLYFAFRLDNEDIWVEAEGIAREKIGDHPEDAAAIHAAHGRLLRRLERGNEALAALESAVAAAGEDDPKRATYVGQLEYLKQNPIRLK